MQESTAFNLNHLRYFYEVARARNMKRAARRIGVSQPALSKQIQALEESLGLQLFYRSPRGMDPTPDGLVVFAHCERVFGHLRDLEGAVDSLRTGSVGRVAIATVASIGVHLLPELLQRFRTEHPRVRVSLVTCRSAEVLAALREHRADVGLVAGEPDSAAVDATRVMANPMRVVVGPEHALAESEGPVRSGALDGVPMVCFDDEAPTRHITFEALQRVGIAPAVVAESPDIEVIKRLVAIGMGFAVLPAHTVRRELDAGELVALPVEGLELSRDLYLVHRQRETLPVAVRRFVEMVDANALRGLPPAGS